MFNFYIDKLTFLRKLRKDSYICELSVSVESQPHIQAHLVFADTQSQNKKPKELEFCQRSNEVNDSRNRNNDSSFIFSRTNF